MAAATLSAPGTEYGPCELGPEGEYLCSHNDCAITYGMVNARCPHCGERIDYDNPFFQVGNNVTDLAHAVCVMEQIEVSK